MLSTAVRAGSNGGWVLMRFSRGGSKCSAAGLMPATARRSRRGRGRRGLNGRAEYRHDLRLYGLARHLGVALADVDVYLRADAELAFQVDARLDGEAGARDDAARIPGLEVVDVGAVAVPLLADGVA